MYRQFICLIVTGKPRGLRTARKHVNHRRDQRWADKDYKKAHLGTRWKANPFGGASHAKGIVLEKVWVSFSLIQWIILVSYCADFDVISSWPFAVYSCVLVFMNPITGVYCEWLLDRVTSGYIGAYCIGICSSSKIFVLVWLWAFICLLALFHASNNFCL